MRKARNRRGKKVQLHLKNRKSNVIAKFKKAPQFGSFPFLTFQDWYDQKETESYDWLIVGRNWRTQDSRFVTLSAIAKIKDIKFLRSILSVSDWEVTADFMTNFSGLSINNDNEYANGYAAYYHKVPGVRFWPFSIFRNLHHYKPDTFELLQDFILFYNAFYIHEKMEYQRVDEDGEVQSIARIRYEGNNLKLEVDSPHLRRYLTSNDCHLVRFHDHSRYSKEDVSHHTSSKKPKGYKFGSSSSIYEVFMARMPITAEGSSYKSISQLWGKDIVYPYEKSSTSSNEKDERKFVSFIVSRDKNGKSKELSCNDHELGNLQALTPVYFKPEVLTRYLQEPSRFTVTVSDLYCLDLWSLPIDRTDEDLIQVWLYHLGKIPYQEQLYWRKFNVFPRGRITQHRFERDFEAKFTAPVNNPVSDFCLVLQKIRDQTKMKYRESLFLDLDQDDRHALTSLHVPFTDEQIEFDQQIEFVAKTLNDSLNVPLLSRETGQRIDPNSDIKGSIYLLKEFLDMIGMPGDDIEKTIGAFHAVQALRSSSTAHRKGEKFKKALKQYDLIKLTNRDRFRKLLVDVTQSLKKISHALT